MKTHYEISSISHEAALEIVKVAIKEGAKLGIAISIAVVDPTLTLVAFGKADGATPHSIETSRRKANTAASTKKKTGWMKDSLEIILPLASNNLLTNIPGGFPISFDGKFLGGLGIAGGTTEQDAEVAKNTLSTIGADLLD